MCTNLNSIGELTLGESFLLHWRDGIASLKNKAGSPVMC